MLKKGEWVWVEADVGVPIGARLKETPAGRRLLVNDDGQEQSLTPELEASLRIMHPTSVEGVDDMITLGDMTEASLLRNLQLRHKQDVIYTYIASVLVAVNPYQNFPIYSGEQVKRYHGRKLGELPPHIFAIAEACYSNTARHHRNQCCIISGESGAGKTESTKLILQYLAAISGDLSHQQIEQEILESNPILEAFGNAKTIHNDNSSRFGKYQEIFMSKAGVIEGARVQQYILEKSRVCRQAQNERNYHIFYCLLAGVSAEERKDLNLRQAADYSYLTQGGCSECEGRDDAGDYRTVRSAMSLFFSKTECQQVLKLLAAILHLGNVCFQATTQNHLETSAVGESEHFSAATTLLEVQRASLATTLTHSSFKTSRERVIRPLSSARASDCRDAFVKAIYDKLFMWIVGKINGVISKRLKKSPESDFLSIGLLDIFGFENFVTNSFEQLCINFANEKLQQFFVGHIFKLEQKEYLKEEVVWNNITFSDNQIILELLAGKPCNLLALIDEESHFPKGSDLTMLQKMNQHHSEDQTYIMSRSERDTDFGIHHFAGVVYYDVKGFLEKNRDAVSDDIIQMVSVSTNQLLHRVFENELSTNGVKMRNSRIIMKPKNVVRNRTDNSKQVPTLSGQFRQSLDSLMKALSACHPFFIRCFKPNSGKQSQVFDRDLCIRQLRYSGMMDTIRIRKQGYPIRHSFEDFLKRYRVLLKTSVCNPKTEKAASCCDAICRASIKRDGDWKIGKTKIFLKEIYDTILERQREQEYNRKALVIQNVMKAHKDRKSFVRKRRAAVLLQRNWRSYSERKEQKKVQHGFERLASRIRSRRLRVEFQRQMMAALIIQRQVRGLLARRRWRRQRAAAVLLQAHTRGLLARRFAEKKRNDVKDLSASERVGSILSLDSLSAFSDPTSRHEENRHEENRHEENRQEENRQEENRQEENRQEENRQEENRQEENRQEENRQEENRQETASDVQLPLVIIQKAEDLPATPTVEEAERDGSESDGSEKRSTPEPPEEDIPPVPVLTVTTTSSEDDDEELDDEFDDSSDEFSLYRFSILHFQGNASHTHLGQRLKQPLLLHEDEGDALACLTVWWIILRFMEDLPEPKSPETSSQASSTITQPLPQRRSRRLSNLVGLDQKILRKNKKKFGGGTRRASAIPEEPENTTEDEDILIGEGPTLDRHLSPLQKLHIIIGYALSRPDIRDEVYCQICKQLTNNKNRKSQMQGWTLLSICLGTFPPTDVLMKYLERFVRRGPGGYGEFCSERLRRIKANGERKELPCWVELQAARSKEPIGVCVTLTDGLSVSVHLDSVSTSAEVCQAVADEIHLKDAYGFSLYISLYDKMWSLGSDGKNVMDAVSQCEQETRRQGRAEKESPWRFSIRKELFTPWHDCSLDPISTDLIYRQVIKGIKSGEYTSEKEDEYVQLAAQHYYIQFGSEFSRDQVQKVVEDCISIPLIENKSMTKWIQLISSAHLQGPYVNGNQKADEVKGELVDSARQKWPLYFSKFYEVTMMSGPPLTRSRFVAAVNWSGVLFMDGRDKKLLELPYLEMKEVQIINPSRENFGAPAVSLTSVRGSYLLKCVEAEEMAALLEKHLDGLRGRSVYALVQQDASKPGDPMFLVCRRGDLLLVDRDEDSSPHSSWFKATNQRTSNCGAVYKDAVQFLPTLSRPSEDVLDLLSPVQRKPWAAPSTAQREEMVAPISLKEFALENFRPPRKEYQRHSGSRGEKLWTCSRDPLKQPLMKSLSSNSELSNLACNAFTAVLKYMGDYPLKHVRSRIELTDQIFGPATQREALQDEIYCQIMRQMTFNNNRLSMELGWQLMWLCLGLFSPGPGLMRHAQRFLESRPRDQLAAESLQRLQEMRSKEPRKFPPHMVEVDAIQQNSTQIFHKVHFPNGTDEIFEVSSRTTIKDLCFSIASHLQLSSPDGYGLYLKTPNQVTSLEEQQYFFDTLRRAAETPKKVKRGKESQQASAALYMVVFKRKLWFNVSPGKDLAADLTFHFPQELPKYLRGYHNCTKEDMIILGGLLFRAQVDSDRSQFVMIPKMMKELVPADKIKSMTAEEWKKHIISSYNKQSGITVQEAKISFLRSISGWPTFGCSFYEVKVCFSGRSVFIITRDASLIGLLQQTCESSYPPTVLMAISKQGVSLIDPKTKEVLVMHPFSRILDYQSHGSSFQMTIGTLLKGVTFLCDTPHAKTMEDLFRSYVSMYEQQRQAFRPRTDIFS